MTATHVMYVGHGHDEGDPGAEYWITDAQALHFLTQMREPKSPFAFFQDHDGITRAYHMGDVRFVEVRKLPGEPTPEEAADAEAMEKRDKLPPTAEVISMLDYKQGSFTRT